MQINNKTRARWVEAQWVDVLLWNHFKDTNNNEKWILIKCEELLIENKHASSALSFCIHLEWVV
jgi:hypothetical protein